jgi:hypothetical protein
MPRNLMWVRLPDDQGPDSLNLPFRAAGRCGLQFSNDAKGDSMNRNGERRRAWLRRFIASGVLGAAGSAGLVRVAVAMARRPFPEGVQQLKGDVRVNGKPATPGMPVNPGDRVVTGANSSVVFVIGSDAYLLRDHTELRIDGTRAEKSPGGELLAPVVKALQILRGKVLAVFGRGEKQINTPTVTVGVRGTAVYVEAEPKRSYVCTCYGEAVLQSKVPGIQETVKTQHHEAPRYIHAPGASQVIEKANVVNHTDDELVMLEALMGRSPPFAGLYGWNQRY